MSDSSSTRASTPGTVRCDDLDAAIAHWTAERGYRLDMIMPADAPRVALLSRDGEMLRLEADRRGGQVAPVEPPQAVTISRHDAADAWVNGRAGMQYRDLIPGRMGGRCIASQIRISDGGRVPDYVHYHKVGFQTIYCRRGWVRVVYEDQGPPFVMREGDCVLQPSTIRHRVLESSAGLEVVEIGCPAEHETWRDHDLELPTSRIDPERRFGSQRFVRHVAADATWRSREPNGVEYRDTGIRDATGGVADVRVFRLAQGARVDAAGLAACTRECDFFFTLMLDGELRIDSQMHGEHALAAGDACTIVGAADFALEACRPCEVLAATVTRWGSGF
jgi:quercetin dioxygenase-like cupin family protein